MEQEIRIYYESYEQAKHFIEPIIKKVSGSIPIKLIYLSKNINKIGNLSIKNILRFKNPDILISFTKGEEEIPLIVLEFSEAVTTEDHELQRFDGCLAAVYGKSLYIKISPFKKSLSEHGGNINFDHIEPYALIYKKFKILSFHFEWPLKDNFFVDRDIDYPSCPTTLNNFNFLLEKVISGVISDYEQIKNNGISDYVLDKIKESAFLMQWIEKIKNYKLLNDFDKFNSSRLKWDRDKKIFIFKFNRMGHSMDPERGMIWYYRLRYNKRIDSRMIFPTTGDSVFKKYKLKNNQDYLNAFIDGSGINKGGIFTKFLIENKYLVNDKLVKNEINITNFLKENIYLLNKPIFAIFFNSEKFLLQDKEEKNRIIFFRDNKVVLDRKDNIYSKNIIKLRDFFSEDDVTYIVSHQILKKNGFNIISLSYPGAQGDRAILPENGSGRKQKREYIDIIASYGDEFINIGESKGKFSPSKVKEDIEKLSFYREDKHRKALTRLLENISPQNIDSTLLLSVNFWLSKKSDLKSVPINKIDFFVTLSSDMKSWKIWTGGDLNIFKYKEGKLDLEDTFYLE